MTLKDRLARRVVPRLVVALSTVDGPRRTEAAVRRLLGGRARIELFVAFDDPQSAFAVLGLVDRLADRPARIMIEPVVARGMPDDPAADAKRRYALIDAARLARRSGLKLSRTQPLTAESTAFLARWAGALPQGPARTEFCVAAMRHLWFSSRGPVEPESYRAMWTQHAAGDPPTANGHPAVRSERRMRRRRLYDTPVAVVHGQWFFAHERLDAIDHRLNQLGWTASP